MYEITLHYNRIEEDRHTEFRFHLCQYFDACFDYNFPFRPLLNFLMESLLKTGLTADVTLPDYYEFEDFVDGSLKMNDGEVAIYFEHSLSYISFHSNSLDDLNLLLTVSQGKRFQHEGYGLKDAEFS